MKRKTLLAVIQLSLALASCAPVSTPASTNLPNPTATLTPTPIPATSTPRPTAIVTQSTVPTSTPFIRENASEDCFLNIDFIPEKTGANEVISVWGDPTEKSSFVGDFEYWYFDFAGAPNARFNKKVLDTVSFYLKDCSLGKIIEKLGEPEKVEIAVLVSCIGGPPLATQNFHYTSLGFSFFRFCDETQDCYTFHSNDFVDGKEFYSSNKKIEDSTGFNMAGYVYNWHGFDVNVEEIENKIMDFVITDLVTRTATP